MSYKITDAEVEAVAVTSIVGDTLDGSVAQNKQVFDNYPDLITEKFNDLCDHVDDDFISQDELGTLANLTTDVKTDTVSAINEVDAHTDTNIANISKVNEKIAYSNATADTNGDFYVDFDSTLTSGDVLKISFPSATLNTADARLSIDGGTTYYNIYMGENLLASAVENKEIELMYNGTQFEPMCEVTDTTDDGTWIKNPDGTLKQWVKKTYGSIDMTTAYGSIFYGAMPAWTFPIEFVDNEVVFSGFSVNQGIGGILKPNVSSTDVTALIWNATSYTATTTIVQMSVDGFWK